MRKIRNPDGTRRRKPMFSALELWAMRERWEEKWIGMPKEGRQGPLPASHGGKYSH